MDHESVQATALKVVFDLLHVYGFDAFNIGSPGEPSSAAKTAGNAEEQSVSCHFSDNYTYKRL